MGIEGSQKKLESLAGSPKRKKALPSPSHLKKRKREPPKTQPLAEELVQFEKKKALKNEEKEETKLKVEFERMREVEHEKKKFKEKLELNKKEMKKLKEEVGKWELELKKAKIGNCTNVFVGNGLACLENNCLYDCSLGINWITHGEFCCVAKVKNVTKKEEGVVFETSFPLKELPFEITSGVKEHNERVLKKFASFSPC